MSTMRALNILWHLDLLISISICNCECWVATFCLFFSLNFFLCSFFLLFYFYVFHCFQRFYEMYSVSVSKVNVHKCLSLWCQCIRTLQLKKSVIYFEEIDARINWVRTVVQCSEWKSQIPTYSNVESFIRLGWVFVFYYPDHYH